MKDKFPDIDVLRDAGLGEYGYIRPMRAADARKIIPQLPDMDEDMQLWLLLQADGVPLALTDEKQGALHVAFEQNLHVSALH